MLGLRRRWLRFFNRFIRRRPSEAARFRDSLRERNESIYRDWQAAVIPRDVVERFLRDVQESQDLPNALLRPDDPMCWICDDETYDFSSVEFYLLLERDYHVDTRQHRDRLADKSLSLLHVARIALQRPARSPE